MKQKVDQKDKKLRKQINGKFNNVGSPDEIKYKISLLNGYFKTIKRQCIYSSIED
jgi:hypothetical protein